MVKYTLNNVKLHKNTNDSDLLTVIDKIPIFERV